MIIIFDLDEVLYDEKTFVLSGFNAVSDYLDKQKLISKKACMSFLRNRFKKKREMIFNELLIKFGVYNKKILHKCIMIYRNHKAKISLYPEAKNCLMQFKELPIYIVTDGNRVVQKNKIDALGLDKFVKQIILTSNYGLNHAKPSTYCFRKICEAEKVKPKNVVYVGDDPNKDFVGIKKAGFKTIRVYKGRFRNMRLGEKFEANYHVKSLKEVNWKLIKDILN